MMQNHWLQDLFDELSPALVLYARQWCAYPDDAVQEAFIDLTKVDPRPNCPKAWLFAATKRKALNITRSESRRKKHHKILLENSQQQEPGSTWFRSTSASELEADEVAACLERLDEEDREILVARIWGDLKFEQLAELMGCSPSSAHRRYASALVTLKQIMTLGDCTPSRSNKSESGNCNFGNSDEPRQE